MTTGRFTFEAPGLPPQLFDVQLPTGDATNELQTESPSELSVLLTQPDIAELHWKDNSPDEARFEVQQSQGAEDYVPLAELPDNATTLTLDRLLPGATYGYRVRAVGPRGASSWSSSATLHLPQPADPSDDDAGPPEPPVPSIPNDAKSIGDLRDARSEGARYILERPCSGGVLLPAGVQIWAADSPTVVVDGRGIDEVLRMGEGVVLVGLRVRGGGVRSQDNHRAAVLMTSKCECFNCEVSETLGVGWGFNKAHDLKIVGLYAHDNGIAGFGGSNGTNVSEWRVRTERNNTSHDSNGGDGKRTRCVNYFMIDHTAVGNFGEGPWFDYNNINVLIARLHAEANEAFYRTPTDPVPRVGGRGLFLEVSGVVQDAPGSSRVRGTGWIRVFNSQFIGNDHGVRPGGFPPVGLCVSATQNVLVSQCTFQRNVIGMMGDRESPFRSTAIRFEDLTFSDIGGWEPIARHPRNRPDEPVYTAERIRIG